ncbi:Dihydroorotate dehydrogenase B (NAD(+)), catalytic subunit [Rubripirellula lacrimiformis]|uniref:Dihydroorotate dehydrogenase B (NAD(+)), catalytic subunit n=1 Tax=Rubripirellula lacrimiformis TaxID=1930273 RepID=A0A517N4N8_9BACT|nr:dihydroorotate dehydrogenase-like protein [Rubripirellula lacrimiformis]QDT02105.1 Dihydroorotate dehydrogenase B (NAD(+)), catalytic subunit [Rubripirellula lacrimiformis]
MSGELAVDYLGLELASPIVVGACPLTKEPETVRQLVGAGAGAIVLPSMLQEQIVHHQMKQDDPLGAIANSGYQPQQDRYNGGVEAYLQTIQLLKDTAGVPIIASMNGSSPGDWLSYAGDLQSAGADALEFNLQAGVPQGREPAGAIEARLADMIRDVCERVSIPVAVKISQRYTNLASMTGQLTQAGAKGIVLFTHLPQWDVCTDRQHWTIRWELSPADSMGGILEGIVRVRAGDENVSIAASGGVATSEDAIKAMIAGANVAMVTSAVYREGPDVVRNMVDGIARHIQISPHTTLREFQAAMPRADVGSERTMRLEYVDPLTRGDSYFDPTPAVPQQTGDSYGHRTQ